MLTSNIAVPSTLQSLSKEELEHLLVCAVKGKAGRDVLTSIFSARYDTKKKINMQIARINQIELINFYQDVKLAGVDIDFNQMYYVVAEAGRGYITIRQ